LWHLKVLLRLLSLIDHLSLLIIYKHLVLLWCNGQF
jgi:hypothetical protein